ncbi:Uncharacterized protein conserved in bacteria [Laribacter hongkongensis HLHK9]|uniref:Uncharacterized protein conserved in bacteria n=2 Tax=Laribacter hongkongensis TaxID=168471 RepID=C1DA31_LARHH|nr:YidB family protein [Laribacter hongkongensis]ACO73144.1 Uncharacterized protein conserved in bacteria [Laribacter hongkongensis HLHK9]
MGLFDSLVNAAGDMMGQGGDTLSAVSNLIQENGGVGGLVEKFQQGGLGDIVSSWVGTGANLPVSAEQIQSVLDGSQLVELAGRLGIDPQQAAEMASQYLPSIVDRLTPNGEIPAGGDLLGHGVELLKGLFNR